MQGEQLYKHWVQVFHNKTYEHYDEVQICCLDKKGKVMLNLIYEESYQKLLGAGYTLLHLG